MQVDRMMSLISVRYLKLGDSFAEYVDKIGICVYFLSDGEYVKIGFANSLPNRMNELQTGNPRPIIPIHAIKANTQNEAASIEKELHMYFQNKNVLGEWFEITEQEIQIAAKRLGYKLIKPIYKHDKRLKINKD